MQSRNLSHSAVCHLRKQLGSSWSHNGISQVQHLCGVFYSFFSTVVQSLEFFLPCVAFADLFSKWSVVRGTRQCSTCTELLGGWPGLGFGVSCNSLLNHLKEQTIYIHVVPCDSKAVCPCVCLFFNTSLQSSLSWLISKLIFA